MEKLLVRDITSASMSLTFPYDDSMCVQKVNKTVANSVWLCTIFQRAE